MITPAGSAWINLQTAAIQLTKTFRPYKAAQHINEEDAFHQVRQVAELSIYPGDLNPRVRWATASSRNLASADFATIRAHARPSLADTVKAVRNQLKDPLADRNPFVLVHYRQLLRAGDQIALKDAVGERIAIVDDNGLDSMQTASLLPLLDRSLHHDQVALLRMIPSLESMTLKAKLLTIVTSDRILRLAL